MSDPNPEPSWFETCTVLVFYGLNSEDEDPDPASPSLALGNLGEPDRLFKSDLPPILSVQTRESFEQELAQAAENAGQDEMCLAAIHKISKWLSKTAPPYVAYELEPPDMAGFSTASTAGPSSWIWKL
jgi:hypothetical protein